MKLTMYGYPKCGTCRDAIKWLQAHGHEVELHDLFEKAPSEKVITGLVKKSGLDIQTFFNTSGEVYKEMKLKDQVKTMTTEQKTALLASNGRLVKRPIVTDGKRVTVGFKDDVYVQAWGL